MNRLITLACLGLLFCLTLFTVSLAQTISGPSLFLPERSFDFREVEEGKVVDHTFKVLNKGNEPLEIRNVNPG
jgi:uncharacterized protein (DUF58 family)